MILRLASLRKLPTMTRPPFRLRKLPTRFGTVVMPLILSIVMTFVVSGIATLKALGLSRSFIETWPVSWALSWLVAFPTLLVVLPFVRRIVAAMVAPPA